MIRCPECNAMLDEMNYPEVICPNCEAVVSTNKKRIETDLPPPPSHQSDDQGYDDEIPVAKLETDQDKFNSPKNKFVPGIGLPPAHYHPEGYGPAPRHPSGYVYPAPIRVKMKVSDMLTDAYHLYREHHETFLRFWAIPAVLSIFLALFIKYLELNYESSGPSGLQFTILVLMPLYITLVVIQILFSGGLIAMTLETIQKGSPKTETGYDIIRDRGEKIVITSFVVSLSIIVGSWLCIIPGLIFCYWYFFAVTIVTLEGFSTTEALKRSQKFSRGQGALPFIIILFLIVGTVNIIGFLFAYALSSISNDFNYMGTLISGIISWIVAPYMYIATAYYYIKGSGVKFADGYKYPTPVQLLEFPPEDPTDELDE